MPVKPKPLNPFQGFIDFENPPIEEKIWPDNSDFPLNRKWYTGRTTVLQEITKDINESEVYLVVTGFTSLAHIITFFGEVNYDRTKKIKIVLGFEPELRKRKFWKNAELTKEIKDYWVEQNYSLLNGGEVIRVIELIKSGIITFKLSDRLHAKIYVGESHAILGSANFSKNGVTIQKEANIRVANDPKKKVQQKQYEEIALIANNFYNEAQDYNQQIISLLQDLLQVTSWQEALARAIAELIERHWLKDMPELYERLNNISLWPSQRLGLGQALYILQTQGCVLIADPTGSGKTKMISTLQLVLYHWLWETGRRNKSYSMTICPPLVLGSWKREFIDLQFSNSSQISMGTLSHTEGNSYLSNMKEIKTANIMVVDEAHNFLRVSSNRSISIAEHTSDHIILSTATPISKRVKDLLRLIELLGVDNLKDTELKEFIELKKRPKTIKTSSNDLNLLKNYISKFIVRRTKRDLNKLIEQSPELYINRQGNECKYPIHDCKTYSTGETENDRKIAADITKLAQDLKGLIFLQDLSKPEYEYDYDEAQYLEKRLKAAKALTVYNIQAKLRSSSAALLEHVAGTDEALEHFKFKSQKNKSGNVLSTLKKHSTNLPKNDFKAYSPEWLNEIDKYQSICIEEIKIYSEIALLTKKLSKLREEKKVDRLVSLFKSHKLILAFDSTVLTLDYLNTILKEKYIDNKIESFVVTGKSSKAMVSNVMRSFDLGSTRENVLAFCSDSMSEGVNLQQASAMVLLDMPSVLRIAEQRIGRIDRLDSPHKKVQLFWPNDSNEFALKTDLKLIRTSIDAEALIGSNFLIPQEILDKHLDQIIKPDEMIKALEENKSKDFLWDGLQDAFKSIHDLYEGETALIKQKDYEIYKNVSATVKVKLSIGVSSRPWLFLAIKGSKSISPRWYFIDANKEIHQELSDICQQLREYLTDTHKWEDKWDDKVKTELNKYFSLLQQNELTLLPSKRQRALKVAQKLLQNLLKQEKQEVKYKAIVNEVLELFNPKTIDNEFSIDYYQLAQQWLDILMPVVYKKKKKLKKGSKDVVSLNSLLKDYKSVDLNMEVLTQMLNNVPLVPSVWNRVAACIIGIPEKI